MWSGDVPRVYLSYRHGERNRRIVRELAERLHRELAEPKDAGTGIAAQCGELFWDKDRLTAADSWEPILRTELKTADIYLFLISTFTADGSHGFMWTQEFPEAVSRLRNDQAWLRSADT